MRSQIATLEGRTDRLQLGGLVALGRGLCGVEPVRLEKYARPVFPGGLDLVGLGQSQQVTLGGQDLPEPIAERRSRAWLVFSVMIRIDMGGTLT